MRVTHEKLFRIILHLAVNLARQYRWVRVDASDAHSARHADSPAKLSAEIHILLARYAHLHEQLDQLFESRNGLNRLFRRSHVSDESACPAGIVSS